MSKTKSDLMLSARGEIRKAQAGLVEAQRLVLCEFNLEKCPFRARELRAIHESFYAQIAATEQTLILMGDK